MSQNLALETAISQLPSLEQHLVRDCAHQIEQLLDRYKDPHLVGLALELVGADLKELIAY
jgi:hypothetical protein